MTPMFLKSGKSLFLLVQLIFIATSCNKGLSYLHSTDSMNYTPVYEYPIVMFNGHGGKEVLIEGGYLTSRFEGDDSIYTSNNGYSIESFKLTIYTRVKSENSPWTFKLKGNKIMGEAHKILFSYGSYKFTFSDVVIKDKWGRYVKPLFKTTTFYTLNL